MGVRAVFLVGFMGSGKSSVGQELAQRWRWDFVDLDARIESREQCSIPKLFQEKGEPAFRQAETAALRDLLDSLKRDAVVALGGGAFAQAQNRELLRFWPSVFLDAPVDELWQRSLRDPGQRPLRKDRNQFARLYAERLSSYREATVTIQTSGKGSVAICTEIEWALHLGEGSEDGGVAPPAVPASNSGTGELQ